MDDTAKPWPAPRHIVAPDRSIELAAQDGWLHMTSSGWYLHVDDVRAEPGLSALVSSDAVWFLAYQDWAGRRPRRWKGRAWRAWRQEESALAVEQAGLVRAAFARPSLREQPSP